MQSPVETSQPRTLKKVRDASGTLGWLSGGMSLTSSNDPTTKINKEVFNKRCEARRSTGLVPPSRSCSGLVAAVDQVSIRQRQAAYQTMVALVAISMIEK